jgi:hypothetical protein
MAIESQVFSASTLNALKTQIDSFFASNTKRLVSVSHGIRDGEYTAIILTFGE